jgi:dipeptidyl aminopeptidase/acylaminoacyl peptidase
MPRFLLAPAVLALCLISSPVIAQEKSQSGGESLPELELAFYRVLAPVALPRPFLADEGRPAWQLSDHFDALPIDLGEADLVQFDALASARRMGIGWRDEEADLDGWLPFDTEETRFEREDFLGGAVTFVEPKAFASVELKIQSRFPLRLRLDGEILATKTSLEKPDAEAGTLTKTLALDPGRHALVIESLRPAKTAAAWTMRATLKGEAVSQEALDAETFLHGYWVAPRFDLPDFIDSRGITDVSISTGGRYIAVSYAEPATPADHRERWTEIRDAETWAEIREIREAIAFRWTDNEDEYFYREARQGKQVIRLGTVGGLESDATPPLEGLVDAHRFLPGFIVTLRREKKKGEEKRDVRRWRGPWDRADSFRVMHRIWWIRSGGPMQFDERDGNRSLVAAGDSALSVEDIDESRGVILVSRPDRTMKERPFSRSELWEIDVDSGEALRLATPTWFRAARFACDGDEILVSAGVSAFGEIGRDPRLGAETIPNEYDTQLYLVPTRNRRAPRCLTRDFDPAIEKAIWNPVDGQIYASARTGTEIGLFRLNLDASGSDAKWERLRFDRDRAPRERGRPLEVIDDFDLETRRGRVALRGSGSRLPPTVMVLDSDRGVLQRRSEGPALEEQVDYRFGICPPGVEDFDVTMADGTVVKGRVHLPSRYESRFRWPAIVYYYAGTVPTDRSFGGRYPKNYWAEKGYIVYVITPSGATGFGQEMSARHVNDWGERSQRELIACTEAFLDAWKSVDRDRVGCIGASYGGFTTMSLMTKTDLFKTGIAHAGISSLASYWGEGYWGYLYSAVATAGKYPWNAPDLYVDRSALFHADKMQGSLLLLHGDADTNVPPGESRQLYTALKLLDKPVEYLEFADENHHILHLPRRRLWAKSIVAWFDRELKGETGWWQHLHPEEASGR